MRELLKRIPGILKQENYQAKDRIVLYPSQFVLIQDGHENRLNIGEEIALDPGSVGDEKEQMTSFVISSQPYSRDDRIELRSSYVSGCRHNGEWVRPTKGTVQELTTQSKPQVHDPEIIDKSRPPQLITSYAESALAQRDGKKYIKGSSMYFNGDKTRLIGLAGYLNIDLLMEINNLFSRVY